MGYVLYFMVPIHESYPKIYPACDVSLRRPMPPDLPHQEGPVLTSLDRGIPRPNFEVFVKEKPY